MAETNQTPTPAEPTTTPTEPTPAADSKTYTQDEFNTELENAKKQWESEYKQKLASENDEAKKLAKMSAEEKLAYQQKQFDDEKSQYRKEKMEFETAKLLADKKLPVGLAKCLCGEDAESTKANITEFEKAFGSAVEAAVADRLKGTPPRTGGSSKPYSMDNLKGMSVEEINAHWDEIKKSK